MPLSNHLPFVKAMCKINGIDVLPDVKLPVKRKKRALETAPRKQEERALRLACIKIYRKRGFWVKSIENAVCGDLGTDFPDLWLFHKGRRWAGYVELKTETGLLSEGQLKFQEYCIACNINHHVIRSELEAKCQP